MMDEYETILQNSDARRWRQFMRNCWIAAASSFIVAAASCCAFGQIKVPPDVSAGQPLVATVAFPDAPEGAKPADLLWNVGDSGFLIVDDSTIHVWPNFGTSDRQLTITVSGGLVSADGKYVPKSNQRFEATLLVRGVLPSPGPGPGPTPGPTPPPEPQPDGEAPIKEPGLRVLISYESQNGYPPWMSNKAFTDFLTSVCVAGPRGQKEWRMIDPDSPVASNAGVWPAAVAKMKDKKEPSILISNGKTGTIEKLPETMAETIALIKKYAEAK